MAGKRRRKPDHEYIYEVDITSWDANIAFNEYAYINIFDREPFTEKIYITLNGAVSLTTSKKIKKGMDAQVVLHPTNSWEKYNWDERELPVGDFIIQNNPELLIARISIPIRSYELIRSYLTYKAQGRIELVGTEINRRNAEIFYVGFNSKTFTVDAEDADE